MSSEDVFRFMALRSVKLDKQGGRLNFYVYPKGLQSGFYREVVKEIAAGGDRRKLAEIARGFMSSKRYITRFAEVSLPIGEMLAWITANGRQTFKKADFLKSIEKIAGKNLADFASSPEFEATYLSLADSVLADILSRNQTVDKEEKISAIKLLFTLRSIHDKAFPLPEEELIDEFFGRSTVVFPLDVNSIRQAPPPAKDPVEPSGPDEKELEKQRALERLNKLEKVHRELSMLAVDENNRWLPQEEAAAVTRLDSLEKRMSALSTRYAESGEQKLAALETGHETGASPAFGEFFLSRHAYHRLSDESKQLLSNLDFNPDRVTPVKAVDQIEKEITYLKSNLEADFSYNKLIAVGGGYVEARKFTQAFMLNRNFDPAAFFLDFHKQCTFKAGIGDLLIVRQKLKAYELAEFAHVENALAGETREREHRRLDVREEITVTETETETTKERDLQSTERNEMEAEAEKTIQQQTHLEAGLQVSGSYGPSISFTASLNAGFSSSVEETQKKSTSYSREVTEKTSEKVRNRVREERTRRVLQQTEEINKHKIDNSDPSNGHMRGIYRWLNKIYDAQIFNYGKRMMYEFVMPEPAAFFLYAMIENPPQDDELIKPEAPTFPIGGSTPLKPLNLSRTNYHSYISLYNVTGAPEPPSQFTVKSYTAKQDGKETNHFGRADVVALPIGYEAYAATISYNSIYTEGAATSGRIMVGGLSIDRNYWGAEYRTFPRKFRGELAVAISLMNKMSFVCSIDTLCSLTDEAFTKWQHQMYDAIIQAYLDQKAAYEAKLEQKSIQKGVEILGRNPLENRRIEREELKKLVVMTLTNTPYLNFNSYLNYPEPIMDLDLSCQNGAYIRFFENAFEWNNMTYVFYPYFWGRHARWINALHLTDPDLDFAAFLKAGAARVQVPVRPGFEKAIAYFCQTGQIWDGNDVPVIGDDLYVPIVKEISESLGKLDDGVPYPEGSEPWEVTIPTSLVVLQDLEEIPNIRDILTGQNIDLRNQNP